MIAGFELESFYNTTSCYAENIVNFVTSYIDINYWQWLACVIYPLALTFILPLLILICVYLSGMFLHLYRLRHLFLEVVTKRDVWDGARKILAALWDAQGKIWHGYEVIGFEKIPEQGPALIVYYHGAIPIDMYYLMAKCILYKNRHPRAIGDRFLFNIPGFSLMLEVFGVMPGTLSSGVEVMKEQHLLSVSPGGVREAFFSDEYYGLLWGGRIGFAKIAVEAKVPIIPMFTQNCREAYRAVSIGKSWFRRLYEKTRLPLVPIYGMFPVKLRTFIGDPIPYDPDRTAEELAGKVHDAVSQLITQHQVIPGNLLRALCERFYTPEQCKVD